MSDELAHGHLEGVDYDSDEGGNEDEAASAEHEQAPGPRDEIELAQKLRRQR